MGLQEKYLWRGEKEQNQIRTRTHRTKCSLREQPVCSRQVVLGVISAPLVLVFTPNRNTIPRVFKDLPASLSLSHPLSSGAEGTTRPAIIAREAINDFTVCITIDGWADSALTSVLSVECFCLLV